ncbi:MAG: hypothetical protein J6Q82_08510 [Clostridia bacterium]|nr:hypothetical protein [Clostridia bacterium]
MQKTEKNIIISDRILRLIKRMEQAGEDAYLVGGSLRDLLLGLSPNDYDLATSALPQKTVEIFADHRVITTGLKHGTVTVMEDAEPIEITTFRIDGLYSDARHPDGVTFTGRIEEDLARRDFTINAMAYHPKIGLIDPFGGREDLEKKILRAVGNPEVRFDEDALRILRAFRFSAQLGFAIEEKTLAGCTESKYGLTKIAKERIAVELLKLLLSKEPTLSLQKMIETGVSFFVFGEYLPSNKLLELLPQMTATDTGKLGFFFSECDEEEARKILEMLRYSKKQITGALAVARGATKKISTPLEARRLIALCGSYAEDACRASILWENSPKEALDWVKESKAPTKISDLKISGRDLMALGYAGREIGLILEELLRLVIDDPTQNEKAKLLELTKNISIN